MEARLGCISLADLRDVRLPHLKKKLLEFSLAMESILNNINQIDHYMSLLVVSIFHYKSVENLDLIKSNHLGPCLDLIKSNHLRLYLSL